MLEVNESCVSETIVDYGPGISEEFRERVFDRFAQTDGSSTRKNSGSGLALAITNLMRTRVFASILN